MNYLNYKRWKA